MHSQNRPRLTVGMPLYNGGAYLETALAKLALQTFQDFVIVASDNSSTDDTWEILERWAKREPRLVLHRQASNIGPRNNFGYVLAKCETEYFMWHAHDDWLSPNYIEELIEVLDRVPSCNLAAASVREVDAETGAEVASWPFPDISERPPLERARILLRNPAAAWLYGVFRTEALRRAFPYGARFRYVLPWDRVVLLEFVLSDTLRGAPDAQITRRRTTVSGSLYYPKKFSGQLKLALALAAEHGHSLRRSPLTLTAKLALVTALVEHLRQTTHLEALDRLWQHVRAVRRKPYRHLVKLPARRLRQKVGRPE